MTYTQQDDQDNTNSPATGADLHDLNNNENNAPAEEAAELSEPQEAPEIEEVAEVPVSMSVFKISDAVFRNPDLVAGQTQIAALEEITQVKAEDKSEETKEFQKKVMIGVLIGCLFFMISGSFFEGLYFRRRLKGGKYAAVN